MKSFFTSLQRLKCRSNFCVSKDKNGGFNKRAYYSNSHIKRLHLIVVDNLIRTGLSHIIINTICESFVVLKEPSEVPLRLSNPCLFSGAEFYLNV